jgi:hypothetical protein
MSTFDPADDSALGALVAGGGARRPLRDAATLNWLYFGSEPLKRTRLVLAARDRGRLVGYAGFRRLPTWLGLLECRVLPGQEEGVARVLLGHARHWAAKRRLSHLLVFPWSRALRSALPPVAGRLPVRRRLGFFLSRGLDDSFELGPWSGDAIVADEAATPAPAR